MEQQVPRAAGDPALPRARRRPLRPAAATSSCRTRVTSARRSRRTATAGRSAPTGATWSRPSSSSAPWAACRPPTSRRYPASRPSRAIGTTPVPGRHDGVDFTGKRVGLIGTGSTGIQATPVIAAEADHLTVFQRTPNYSVPARNYPDHARADGRRSRPTTARSAASPGRPSGGFPYDRSEISAMAVTPEEREATYEQLWAEEGGFKFVYGSYNDLLINIEQPTTPPPSSSAARSAQIVKDPVVAEALAPKDYPYGTKRPPIDTDYFETFNRDNVTLVDLRADADRRDHARLGSARPRRTTTSMSSCSPPGFDAMTGSLLKIDIRGRDGPAAQGQVGGRSASPTSALQVAGFPNLFVITGPGSPSVLTNMPVSIEQHVEWIGDCITYLRRAGPDQHRGHRGGRGGVGRPRPRGGGADPLHPGQLLVPRGQHPRQEAGVHALRGRVRPVPDSGATRWPPRATRASPCRAGPTDRGRPRPLISHPWCRRWPPGSGRRGRRAGPAPR